ncbi:hypothetical protein [Nocardia sp. NPDC050710]|uniref:hypothetical protein n=1 Tax=Nocardia sp. NPDC050710 TaxID=3157220 RepID=UPI0033DC0DEA
MGSNTIPGDEVAAHKVAVSIVAALVAHFAPRAAEDRACKLKLQDCLRMRALLDDPSDTAAVRAVLDGQYADDYRALTARR